MTLVGGVHDRLVLLVPVHTVMLMTFASEHLHNLTSARRLAGDSTRLNPIARAGDQV